MKMQCPSTSVTTLWVTSVKAPVCWLELASSTRSETLNGEFNKKKKKSSCGIVKQIGF